ncbi:hypothetical protein KJ359_010181 [Pestalotiopsis sp. 9143b]|nr:hypothetical protein KJ359_010181 [Pestalotiopsis sp. 9143b]
MSSVELPLWVCVIIAVLAVPVILYHLVKLVFKMIAIHRVWEENRKFDECITKGWEAYERLQAERQAAAMEEGLGDMITRLEAFHISE